MTTARNNSTEIAIDTRDLGPNICYLPTLEAASSYFFPWLKNGTQTRQNGHIPHVGSPMFFLSQGEDTWGHTLFDAG